MGTYSSINIRYVPTNMYKQSSAIMGSKFEVEDEKQSNSVEPIAEENKEQEEPTQTGFVE